MTSNSNILGKNMKLEQYLYEIEDFIKNYLSSTKMEGYVLGLSGGIDSALVARLTQEAVGNNKLFCVMMPCHSVEDDLRDAIEFAEKFNINYVIVDLSATFDQIKKAIIDEHPLEGLAEHNIKVRLRMVTLYAIAQQRKSLVLGTDNWDENYVGYFTKYGDGGADLLPIVHLTKGEVFEASKILNVTDNIINKIPTAGLFTGQTDEKEMGIKYSDLDNFLLGKNVNDDSKKIIEKLHRVSEHKRQLIPCPQKFIR